MTILLLIRHATNDYVQAGRLAGRTPDVHINGAGQREADDLARRLAHLKIEAIYSSPLERAVETAQTIAACHHLPVHIREGLIEGDAGEWTGKLLKDLHDTETWKAIQTKPIGVKLPGGESIDEVQARMVATIEEIRRAHPDGIVAVVSHSDPLKSVIAHYLHWDLDNFQRIEISPASLSVLAVDDKHETLLRLNDTGALPKFEKPKKDSKTADETGTDITNADSRKENSNMAEANIVFDLNPVNRVTVGAIGEPGQRVFYLQARQNSTLVTLVTEKEQMASLGQGITDLLARLGERADQPVDVSEYELTLEEPLDPLFRIGQLGLGFDQESDRLVIVAYSLPFEENQETVDVVRVWGSRDQMRALARHITEVAAAGRPICVLCGKPIDPAGHFCPRRNGHGEKAALV